MASAQTFAHQVEPDTAVEFDAIVIGAGVSGLYQLYKLRGLGLRVRVFETGMRDHDGYTSYPLMCAVQQLVMDRIAEPDAIPAATPPAASAAPAAASPAAPAPAAAADSALVPTSVETPGKAP